MKRRMNLAAFDRRILKLTEKIFKYSTVEADITELNKKKHGRQE